MKIFNTPIDLKPFTALSILTRILIIGALIFLSYGYLCRLLGIYFFWESKTIGWTLFWIAMVFILLDKIKLKKLQDGKTVPEKIGVGLSVFVIIVKGILFFVTQQTTAFEDAVSFIKSNSEIQEKVGTVNSVFLVPIGGMSMTTGKQGTAGNADLHFTVKGSQKFLDLNLLMSKDFETDWVIEIKK